MGSGLPTTSFDYEAFMANKLGVPCGPLFHPGSQAIFFNYKKAPVQRMLDFDYVCNRSTPSVAAIVAPGERNGGFHKAFFGKDEVAIPIFGSINDAANSHKNADVFINFASFRSAYESSTIALEMPTIKVVVIIAEGVPERQTKILISKATRMGKTIIGPATVGGIQAGAFKIGDTAGTIENIITCKLYRPGSVGFVSKSGGLSNEAYNVLARTTDGLFEGIAVGGDAFPGTSLSYHVARFETIDQIKMIVMLGELGGTDEYDVVYMLKKKLITKPVVAWVSGTCAKWFNSSEVQFGHSGAKTGGVDESAESKIAALTAAGAIVPKSFEGFADSIKATFDSLVAQGKHQPVPDIKPKLLPKDLGAALKAGELRVATNIVCTISDDRGEEPTYIGVPISEIIQENYTIGEVISLLWFKTLLPAWAIKFIEIVLATAADHGPCVSGAHNTIVAARAGRDLGASLCSGLLTIGPRFGGAVDQAAINFKIACDSQTTPADFVEGMKKKGLRVEGIGHRIKTAENRDKRVLLLSDYARKNFPSTKYLEYAEKVEEYTLSKSNNLVLNVDGCLGALFVDMLGSCGLYDGEEVMEILELGALNGIFILSRSIGLIGHFLDQKRMKQPLYRHPYDDVLYTKAERPHRNSNHPAPTDWDDSNVQSFDD